MENVRIGFIGLGGIATRSHIPALAAIPNVTIQAGAEVNPVQAERTQRRFGIPQVYASYQEMIDKESLDAVYVCLPSFLHYEASMAALSKGLHVYCEKPMGLSSQEAFAMVAEAERRNLVLAPGYNLRFYPYFERARQLLKAKRLGKVLQIHGMAAKPGPYIGWDPKSDWYFDQRNVGVLYDQGCHVMDLLFYLTRLDVDQVKASARTSLPGLPVPDNIVSVFRSRTGTIGSLSLAWGAPGNITLLQIHGTAGTVIVSDSYFEHRTAQGGGVEKMTMFLGNAFQVLTRSWRALRNRQSADATYVESSQNFIDAITRGTPLRASARDAAEVHRVLETIAVSIREDAPAERHQVTVAA